jgi:hypothetical protein
MTNLEVMDVKEILKILTGSNLSEQQLFVLSVCLSGETSQSGRHLIDPKHEVYQAYKVMKNVLLNSDINIDEIYYDKP